LKYCYLLGYPVGHSVSPVMQNAAFRFKGLDVEYRLAKVSPKNLARFIEEHRDETVLGFNVTIPHKIEVIKYLDEIDENASSIGAVNTVKNNEGQLIGYNTDGVGGVKPLEEAYGLLSNSKVLILGSGGAAKALAYELSRRVRRLFILNRTPSKAHDLASKLRSMTGANITGDGLDAIEHALSQADILINTTPIGMVPKTEESPVNKNMLRKDLFVYDIVYNPIKTKLLRDAETIGAETLSGVKMLVYQGAEAFHIWTGDKPPTKIMLNAVLAKLGG
jgi:shikimate dehydrogenase